MTNVPKNPAQPGAVQICNIRASDANAWRGETTPDGAKFETFDTVSDALRACGKLILGYKAKTPLAIATKYAPPVENNTVRYARGLAIELGLKDQPGLPAIRQTIDPEDPDVMAKLLRRIPFQETGYIPSWADVAKAIQMLFGVDWHP
jgi:hypothetical protein